MPLIPRHEEEKLFEKLVKYYENLYPGVKFAKREATLTRKEIGEILYTYPGEESEATFAEKVAAISDAIKYGYDAPVIILRKEKAKTDILLDGHRRLKVAWDKGLGWKALIMVPDREMEFGIEKMAIGKIREIWR
jgi:hypothetical protein